MDIARLLTGAGILGLVVYGLWWLAQRVRTMPASASKDEVIEAFALVVETIQPDSEECIRACEIIRIELAEKIMPMESDPK